MLGLKKESVSAYVPCSSLNGLSQTKTLWGHKSGNEKANLKVGAYNRKQTSDVKMNFVTAAKTRKNTF